AANPVDDSLDFAIRLPADPVVNGTQAFWVREIEVGDLGTVRCPAAAQKLRVERNVVAHPQRVGDRKLDLRIEMVEHLYKLRIGPSEGIEIEIAKFERLGDRLPSRTARAVGDKCKSQSDATGRDKHIFAALMPGDLVKELEGEVCIWGDKRVFGHCA